MKTAKISGSSPKTYAAVYDKLKGVDFSTDPGMIAQERSPWAPNLVSGPGGYPEKRPGWRTVRSLEGAIYGLYSGRIGGEDIFLVHSGSTIYRWKPYDPSFAPVSLKTGVKEGYSTGFAFGEKIYILTGAEYLVCGMFGDKGSETLQIVTAGSIARVPTIVISAGESGGGTTLEPANLLTDRRKVSYLCGGGERLLVLPEQNHMEDGLCVRIRDENTGEWTEQTYEAVKTIGPTDASTVKTAYKEYKTDAESSGETVLSFEEWYRSRYVLYKGLYWSKSPTTTTGTNRPMYIPGTGSVSDSTGVNNKAVMGINKEYGILWLSQNQASTLWDATGSGVDNLEIEYRKAAEEGKDDLSTLNACDTFGLFENRVFLTGNPDKPAYDWHSGPDDPTYFPDTGYAKVGAGGSAIMGYRAVGSAQAIIKAESRQDASVYLRTAAKLGEETVFSLRQGVSGQGAIAKRAFANILDDPLFLTRNGVYAITSNLVTEERTLAGRSRFLDPRLTREQNLEQAVGCGWNGMYLLSMTDGNVYLLDGKQNKVYLDNSITGANYNYEAYHWTDLPATVWMPDGENLFFGTADGRLCRLNTDIQSVEKYNDDGAPVKAARATRVEFCGDFLRYKTMVKKGSGLLLQPYSRASVRVYVRTDKSQARKFFTGALDDYDWHGDELGADFSAWEGSRVVPFKKKVKKWKWIQIIVENDRVNEGFGIYGIIIRHQKLGLV